jgi:hypothetical protein
MSAATPKLLKETLASLMAECSMDENLPANKKVLLESLMRHIKGCLTAYETYLRSS